MTSQESSLIAIAVYTALRITIIHFNSMALFNETFKCTLSIRNSEDIGLALYYALQIIPTQLSITFY